MLKDFVNYENLKLMPRYKYDNLLQQNKKIINEINIMKIKLQSNPNLYSAAEIDYKKITRKIDIPFLRRLMYEQEINFSNNNVLINFSIEDDNVNLEQNILLKRLINHKEMHNLIKFFVLKKYCSKINTEEVNKSKKNSASKPISSSNLPPDSSSDSPPSPSQASSNTSPNTSSQASPNTSSNASPNALPKTSPNTLEKINDKLKAGLLSLNEELERIKKEKLDKEKEYKKIQEEKNSLQKEIDLLKKGDKSKELSLKLDDFEKQLGEKEKELVKKNQELGQKDQELGQKDQEFNQLQDLFKQKMSSLREAECLQESSNLKIESLEKKTLALNELQQQISNLRNEKIIYEEVLVTRKAKLDENELELNLKDEAIAELQAEIAKTQLQLQQREEEITKIKQQLQQREEEFAKETCENEESVSRVDKQIEQLILEQQLQQSDKLHLEQQHSAQLQQLQSDKLHLEQQHSAQLQQLQLQIASHQEKLSSLNINFTKKTQLIALLLQEKKILIDSNRELTAELTKTKELLRQQQSKNASLEEETDKQLAEIKSARDEIIRMRQQLIRLEQERKPQESLIEKLQKTIIALVADRDEERTAFIIAQKKLSRQIDLLNQQNQEKDRKLEELTLENLDKGIQLESALRERDDIRRRLENEVKKVSFLEEQIMKLIEELNDARRLLAEEKEKNARFRLEEEEKVKGIEERYKKDIQDLEGKVRQLQLQLQKKADLTEEQRQLFSKRINQLLESQQSLQQKLSSMERERASIFAEMERKTEESRLKVDNLMLQMEMKDEELRQSYRKNWDMKGWNQSMAVEVARSSSKLTRTSSLLEEQKSANVALQSIIASDKALIKVLSDKLHQSGEENRRLQTEIQGITQQLEESLQREQELNLRLENSWEAWLSRGVDTVVSVPGRVVDTVADLTRHGIDAAAAFPGRVAELGQQALSYVNPNAVGGKGYTEDNKYYKKYLKYKKKYLEVK